eukprot:tig00020703_g13127.t1
MTAPGHGRSSRRRSSAWVPGALDLRARARFLELASEPCEHSAAERPATAAAKVRNMIGEDLGLRVPLEMISRATGTVALETHLLFVREVAVAFLGMFLCSAPLILLYASGPGDPVEGPLPGAAATTLGNLGTGRANRTSGAGGPERDVVFALGRVPLPRASVALLAAGVDALATLCGVAALLRLPRRVRPAPQALGAAAHGRQLRALVRERTGCIATLGSYGVEVRGLPADAREGELRAYFEALLPAAVVVLVRDSARLVDLYRRRAAALRRVRPPRPAPPLSDAAQLAAAEDLVRRSGGRRGEAAFLGANRRLFKANRRIEEAAGEGALAGQRVLLAYLTFERAAHQRDAIAAFRSLWPRHRPPEPGSILWENVHVAGWSAVGRRLLATLATALIIGVAFALAAALSSSFPRTAAPAAGPCPDAAAAAEVLEADARCRAAYCAQLGPAGLVREAARCGPFAAGPASTASWAALTALLSFAVNALLPPLIRRLVRVERHASRAALNDSLAWKLLLASLANTGLVALLANARLAGDAWADAGWAPLLRGAFPDFTPRWYAALGPSLIASVWLAAAAWPLRLLLLRLWRLASDRLARRRGRRAGPAQEGAGPGAEVEGAEGGAALVGAAAVALLFSGGCRWFSGRRRRRIRPLLRREGRRPRLAPRPRPSLLPAPPLCPRAALIAPLLHLPLAAWQLSAPSLFPSDVVAAGEVPQALTGGAWGGAAEGSPLGAAPRLGRLAVLPLVLLFCIGASLLLLHIALSLLSLSLPSLLRRATAALLAPAPEPLDETLRPSDLPPLRTTVRELEARGWLTSYRIDANPAYAGRLQLPPDSRPAFYARRGACCALPCPPDAAAAPGALDLFPARVAPRRLSLLLLGPAGASDGEGSGGEGWGEGGSGGSGASGASGRRARGAQATPTPHALSCSR